MNRRELIKRGAVLVPAVALFGVPTLAQAAPTPTAEVGDLVTWVFPEGDRVVGVVDRELYRMNGRYFIDPIQHDFQRFVQTIPGERCGYGRKLDEMEIVAKAGTWENREPHRGDRVLFKDAWGDEETGIVVGPWHDADGGQAYEIATRRWAERENDLTKIRELAGAVRSYRRTVDEFAVTAHWGEWFDDRHTLRFLSQFSF